MATAEQLAAALYDSPEATELNITIAGLRQEQQRLRQRIADLATAQQDLDRVTQQLQEAVAQGAQLIQTLMNAAHAADAQPTPILSEQ